MFVSFDKFLLVMFTIQFSILPSVSVKLSKEDRESIRKFILDWHRKSLKRKSQNTHSRYGYEEYLMDQSSNSHDPEHIPRDYVEEATKFISFGHTFIDPQLNAHYLPGTFTVLPPVSPSLLAGSGYKYYPGSSGPKEYHSPTPPHHHHHHYDDHYDDDHPPHKHKYSDYHIIKPSHPDVISPHKGYPHHLPVHVALPSYSEHHHRQRHRIPHWVWPFLIAAVLPLILGTIFLPLAMIFILNLFMAMATIGGLRPLNQFIPTLPAGLPAGIAG
ncbi:uncharacterized protein LOC141856492 [Brevipalpus obovatus]|uniref:uncharacterized protein LOC141856492 n=1 Tax=Brevipalpus obovatus TaxID=246614 RepID=UPI003D9F8B75